MKLSKIMQRLLLLFLLVFSANSFSVSLNKGYVPASTLADITATKSDLVSAAGAGVFIIVLIFALKSLRKVT